MEECRLVGENLKEHARNVLQGLTTTNGSLSSNSPAWLKKATVNSAKTSLHKIITINLSALRGFFFI